MGSQGWHDRNDRPGDAQLAASLADRYCVEPSVGVGSRAAWFDQLWAAIRAC